MEIHIPTVYNEDNIFEFRFVVSQLLFPAGMLPSYLLSKKSRSGCFGSNLKAKISSEITFFWFEHLLSNSNIFENWNKMLQMQNQNSNWIGKQAVASLSEYISTVNRNMDYSKNIYNAEKSICVLVYQEVTSRLEHKFL